MSLIICLKLKSIIVIFYLILYKKHLHYYFKLLLENFIIIRLKTIKINCFATVGGINLATFRKTTFLPLTKQECIN